MNILQNLELMNLNIFFIDDFNGKKGISRAQYIKNKFKESITKQKIIKNEEIEKIISSFSKLRRAKVFSERDYYLFDLSLSGMLNNKFFNENASISEESSKKYIYNNNKKETKNLIEDDFLMISENLKKHTIKKKINFDSYLDANILNFDDNEESLSFSFISEI